LERDLVAMADDPDRRVDATGADHHLPGPVQRRFVG
jgi:hypothetical protein